MNQITIIVSCEEVGMRLDSAVSKLNSHISRTKAEEFIKEKKVLLDGKEAKVSTKVKLGQEITMPSEVEEKVNEKLVAEDIPVDILYEDDDIVVVNKPKNMVVHPASRKLVWNTCQCNAWKKGFVR